MHWNRWRFLVACLLLVVMPLQGFAAATRLNCHTAPTAPTAHSAHATHKAASAQPTQSAHAHHGAPDHHKDHASPTLAKADQCNACSPCCAGVLVSQRPVMALPEFARLFDFYIPDSRHSNPSLDGLERPPRYPVV